MGYCGHCVGFAGLRARVFSYNKRTMDGAFLALVAVPRINNLRVLNTLDSSTPAAASTTIYIVINNLQEKKLYVQCSYSLFRKRGLIDGRNSSVSSNGKRGYGPSLKPLFIRARAAKAPTQASPSVAPAPYAAQRANPTVPAASRSIVPGQDRPASSILSGREF